MLRLCGFHFFCLIFPPFDFCLHIMITSFFIIITIIFIFSCLIQPPSVCISWLPQLANLWPRSWISPKYSDNFEIIYYWKNFYNQSFTFYISPKSLSPWKLIKLQWTKECSNLTFLFWFKWKFQKWWTCEIKSTYTEDLAKLKFSLIILNSRDHQFANVIILNSNSQ